MGILILGAASNDFSIAFAAEEESFSLDQVVVTATRTEKAIIDTPANTQVITGEDIKNGGYTSAFEAVKNLAQANVHTYQEDGGDYGGMMSRIRMRGIDQGTLVLINGNPVNYMNNATLNTIPLDQIEKIEIVKGASAVLYGPQAIGGVINIITKKPGATDKASGSIYGTVGNRFEESGLNLQTDSFNIGMKKSFSDDLNGVQPVGSTGSGTAMNIKDKKADQMYLDVNLAKDLTFSYGRTNNKSKFETGSFTNYVSVMNYLADSTTTYNNYSLLYDCHDTGLKIAAGYNTIDIETVYDKSYPKQYSDSDFSGYNSNLDVQKLFKLRDEKDSLVLGGNFTSEHMKYHYGTATNGNNDRDSYSLYQSYDYQATDKLSYILGLREYYMSSSKYQDSDFQLLPQFQALYKVNKNSSYYLNSGKSFEMPAINSGFNYNSSFVVNPDLKPQSGWSHEVGYKYEDGDRTITADVFYMDVKDKFYWDKDSTGASIMRNRDKWKNTGLEFNYKQKINAEMTANAGLTIQNPKAQSGSSGWVQDSSKYVLNVGANYNKAKFMADARVFAYLDREPAYYNYERTSSKIHDHNLADSCDLTVTLGYKPTKVDSLKLIGRNLLNREDAVNNYEYISTPANFTLTYERSF